MYITSSICILPVIYAVINMDYTKYKSVVVTNEIHERLLRRKKYPKQSFNDVIEELINNGKQ